MKSIFGIISIVLITVSCQSTSIITADNSLDTQPPYIGDLKLKVETGIKSVLQKLESARFESVVTLGSQNSGILVCGYVSRDGNVQSAVQRMPFVSGVDTAGDVYMAEVADNIKSEQVIKQFCEQNGLIL